MENQFAEYEYLAEEPLAAFGIDEEYTGNHLVNAIENNDFVLLYQLIDPLNINSPNGRHYEVFVRLIEEEECHLPPGAFFPLAERHGLMPTLDRWVVRNVLRLAAGSQSRNILDDGSMFFVNLAGATIRDPDFPRYVQSHLQAYGIAGDRLCFEIPGREVSHSRAGIARFAKAIRTIGCRVAISGFDRDTVNFELLGGFQIDFLKIDGSIIFNIHRESLELGKTVAIQKAAKKLGVKTVAEFVESEEDISMLREIGIDFVQGFGVSKPMVFEANYT